MNTNKEKKGAINEFLTIIDNRIKQILKVASEKFSKLQKGTVVMYESDTYIATIKFDGDNDDSYYEYINKTGELLSEGDRVGIMYYTSASRGVLLIRYGDPVYPDREELPRYISQVINNESSVKLEKITNSILSVDFVVSDKTSDVVLNANQQINTTNAGVVNYTYRVDDIELNYKPSQYLLEGNNIVTHVIPMDLLAGSHNVVIQQMSEDAQGTTSKECIQGVISGMIEQIDVKSPPNYNNIFKLEIPSDNTEITFPSISTNSSSGTIYWGDGAYEDYNNLDLKHIYETAGTYEVVVTNNYVDIGSGYRPSDQIKNYLIEVQFSDNVIKINDNAFYGCGNLKSIGFGSKITTIGAEAFRFSGISGRLVIPKTVKELGGLSFFGCNNITSLYLDCPNLTKFHNSPNDTYSNPNFDECNSLIDVYYNASRVPDYEFWTCKALQNVIIGDSVVSIGGQSFRECNSLTSVSIPSSVKSIGQAAFRGCSLLETVTLPPDCYYYPNGASFSWNTVVIGGTIVS